MPVSPAAQTDIDAIAAQTTLNASVQTWINGEQTRIAAAVAAAIAGGFTADDVAALNAAVAAMGTSAPQVPAALIKNTKITPAMAAGK